MADTGFVPDWWDDKLSYRTIRMVTIRRKCVGILHYFFMFCIIMYLVFYVFIVQKKYLKIDSPVASIRINSMGPCQPKTSAGLCKAASKAVPIAAVGEKCERNFACDKHAYCAKPGQNMSTSAAGKQQCVFFDHNTVTWPPSEIGSLTLATRASLYNQRLVSGTSGLDCGPTNDKQLPQTRFDCQYQPSISSGHSLDAYVADVGNFTIAIDQVVAASSLPISKTGMEMHGDLLRCKPGAECEYAAIDSFESVKKFVPSKANHGDARLTVSEILDAVVPPQHKGVSRGKPGVDLDAMNSGCPDKCIQVSTGKHQKQSNRWTGLVVLLDLQYDNTGLLIKESSKNDVRFRLRPYVVKGSAFRVEVPFVQKNNTRVIHHLHGIRFLAMVKGNLGEVDFNTILVQLTTSVTMIFLATTIVDVAITRCMVDRKYFQALKYADDTAAVSAEQLEAQGVPLERKEGIDWRALFTFGLGTSKDSTAPNEESENLVGGSLRPNAGSGSSTMPSVDADETTPFFNEDGPTTKGRQQSPGHSGRGGCCRPAKDRPLEA